MAGLISGILLVRAGFRVHLFEKRKYPFHRVCGEYISNEVIPFLRNQELYPDELAPASISRFCLTSSSGKKLEMPLDLGAFGVSRFSLDYWLFKKAEKEGVKVIHERVVSATFQDDQFQIEPGNGDLYDFDLVIGAFGKRSPLDKKLDRPFSLSPSKYVGVKYHLKTDEVPDDVIALHNFVGGYCGISRVEDGNFNLCYLSTKAQLKKYGTIPELENEVLGKNPFLHRILNNSEFLFEQPKVINDISFSPKEPVYNHILMNGDAAGLITPLCGNGMALAIHSAKVLVDHIIQNVKEGFDRGSLESEYARSWNTLFAKRLWAGRKIQSLFGAALISEAAVGLGKVFPPFAKALMAKTHGQPFS